MEKALTKQKIKILTGVGIEGLTPGANSVTAKIKGKDGAVTSEEFSHAIVAIGIVPNVENIGLEAVGVEPDKRFHIKVDGYGRTNVEGIWAIGDVTGPPWLAHKASHEGVIAVEKMAGTQRRSARNTAAPGTARSIRV